MYGVSKHIRPRLLAGLATALLVAGCGTAADQAGDQATGAAPSSATRPSSAPVSARHTSTTTGSRESRRPRPLVVLDPGHNGGNAAHPAEINKKVPAGRGRTKPCNTTGTATASGYPEHALTWDVANRVGASLRAHGVRVLRTRDSDRGVGPCVNQRAAAANRAGAAAVVSIHADGANAQTAHGFHVSYAAPPLRAAQGAPSRRLARTLRDTMRGEGLATSTYLGSHGINPRDDLGGLNLSTRPAVLVECGNMRNPEEAAAFTSAKGRARYASAITDGMLGYLDKEK